ncbi:hypothetical protein P154DRAFT_408736, partial [Amniculicola lignicola CBS 123094]
EQTNNGEYKFITYHTFRAVDYNRIMFWTAGSGRIGVGVRQITSQNTNIDNTEGVDLPRGQSVVVMDTNFKLVRK